MKKLKQIFSLILCTAIICSICTGALDRKIYASTEDKIDGKTEDVIDGKTDGKTDGKIKNKSLEYSQNVGLLQSLKIVKLDTKGKLLPSDENITKEEFVYMIIKSMNYESLAKPEKQDFSDVPVDHEYAEYISMAKSLGIVSGSDSKRFGMGDYISLNQGVKMVVEGLNMGNIALSSGGYPMGYLNVASQYGVMLGIKNEGENITRNTAVNLVFNMLNAPYMKQNSVGERIKYTIDDKNTLLYEKFKIRRYKGVVTGDYLTSLNRKLSDDKIEIDNEIFEINSAYSSDFVGYGVNYYYSEDEDFKCIVHLEKLGNNKETIFDVQHLVGGIISGSNIEISYLDRNITQKIKLPLASNFIYNNKYSNFQMKYIENLDGKSLGNIAVVENYKGDYTLRIFDYEVVIIGGISISDNAIWGKYNESLDLSKEDKKIVDISKNGEKIDITKLAVDDILNIIQSEDKTYTNIMVTNNRVQGKVNELEYGGGSQNFVVIDGVKYGINMHSISKPTMPKLTLDIVGTFSFDMGGNLVDIEIDMAKGDYGYLVGMAITGTLNSAAKVDFINLSGKKVTFNVDPKVKVDEVKSKGNLRDVIMTSKLVENGSVKRQLIYYELVNSEVSLMQTAKDATANAPLSQRNEYIKDNRFRVTGKMAEKKFKYNTASFLPDTDDAKAPEFYMSREAKILVVPASNAEISECLNEDNYSTTSWNSFIDADNYYVEAYNGDAFNKCDILIYTTTLEKSLQELEKFVVVDKYVKKMDAENQEVEVICGMQKGEAVQIEGKDENVFKHTVNGDLIKYKKGDVVQFAMQNGKAIASLFRTNVYENNVAFSSEGKNNGILCAVGVIDSARDEFITLKLGLDPSNNRVFRCDKSAFSIMIADKKTKKVYKGTFGDLTPGSKIIMRANYTLAQECVVILD